MISKTTQQKAELVKAWFAAIPLEQKNFIAVKAVTYYGVFQKLNTKISISEFYTLLENPENLENVINCFTATAYSLLKAKDDVTSWRVISLEEYMENLDDDPLTAEFIAMMPGESRYEKLTSNYYALLEVRESWFELLDKELQ